MVVQKADVANYGLSKAVFDALADGSSGAAEMELLLQSELSRRLFMLRSLMLTAREQPELLGPLPSREVAWGAIVTSQQRSPEHLQSMLLYPQIGMWMGHTLRRLRGARVGRVPMWKHVGHLHAFAAVLALHSGAELQTSVPIWKGKVVFPAFGFLQLAEVAPDAAAEVMCADGTLQVMTADGPVSISADGQSDSVDWHSLLYVDSVINGQALHVAIDDFDPYRETLNDEPPPEPLTSEQRTFWRNTVESAWEMLVRDHPERADEMTNGLLSITPLPREPHMRGRSASSGDTFGGVIASEPENPTQLVVALVHELQHSKLNALLHLTDFQEPCTALFHAPWRDDPRPLGGMIHGAYSFSAVTEFWDKRRSVDSGTDADLAHFEFALWKRNARECSKAIERRQELTDVGRAFVAGMLSRNVADATVPIRLSGMAEIAALDHYLAWRVHYVEPDELTVSQYLQAWLAKESAPQIISLDDEMIKPEWRACNIEGRAVLMRLLITNDEEFTRLRSHPEDVPTSVRGAIAADLAFIDGDVALARSQYLSALLNGDDRGQIWSGITLTAESPAAEVLRTNPELVRALRQAILEKTDEIVDPVTIATWMGQK